MIESQRHLPLAQINLRELRRSTPTQVASPQVNYFPLHTPEGQKDFLESLFHAAHLPHIDLQHYERRDLELILQQATASELIIDHFDHHLRKRAQTEKGKEWAGINRYLNLFDNLYSGVMVEFPWRHQDGRFVHTLAEREHVALLYSRNRYVIPDEILGKLDKLHVGVIGASVGGIIAYMLGMVGVRNFVVCDGGLVDPNDLNRQIKTVQDIGGSQAITTGRSLLEHNPWSFIKAYPQNLGDGSNNTLAVERFLEEVGPNGIVIDAMDGFPMKLSLRAQPDIVERMSRLNQQLVMGTDLGFGSAFQGETLGKPFQGRLTPEVVQRLKDPALSLAEKTQIAAQVMVGEQNIPPHYLLALQQALAEGATFWPQPGIAAFLTAAIAGVQLVRLAEGYDIRGEVSLDLLKAVTSS